MFQSGDVIYIYCVYAKPKPKYKYAIAINENPPLFFLINTQPRKSTPDAQIYIQKHELPCLTHDSFVDTSKLVTFSDDEIKKAEKKGTLIDVIKERIIFAINSHAYLPHGHVKLALNNLTPPIDS